MEDIRKIERKKKKFAARLLSNKGIECKEESGPNIVLCNVGQATGLEKQTILNILDDLGGIKLKKFIAEKGESYSFLVFHSTQDAQLFYEKRNGKPISAENASPTYMSYVTKVPETEVVCSDKNPDGLTILQNFISDEEEKELIKLFDWTEESNLKNRLVKHYGYEFRYGSNDVDLTSPLEETIPVQCDMLWTRLKEYGIEFVVPDQLTVNKYAPGQGIPSHVDRHSPFGNTILSLSLGSSVVMDWKHHSGRYVPVVVPSRSMLVMQGEARYDWQHGIQPRTWDPVIETRTEPEPVRVMTHDTAPRGTRISLTFRRTRAGPCGCQYKVLCDVSEAGDIADDVASALEELHVHQVYEQIASHFSHTRRSVWGAVERFLRGAPPAALLLDLGAGNGKNVMPRPDLMQIACERSSGLVAECSRRLRAGGVGRAGGADCVRLDVLRAPLRDACADLVLSVAVIHHFSSAARRREAIGTIARLLRAGGRALVTVWAREQGGARYLRADRGDGGERGEQGAVHATAAGVALPVHASRTQFAHSDLLVPWKLRPTPAAPAPPAPPADTTLLRYYHVFEEGELEQLCSRPDLVVETSFYEEGNWCVICKKI